MSLSRVLRISQSSGIVARPSTRSSRRFLHSSPPVGVAPGKDPQLSQGGVSQKGHRHPGDAHDQAARSGQSTADKSPYDAASPHPDKQASRQGLSGNPEGVGFAEQVGSASSSADHGLGPSEGKGGHEESTPPGFLDAVKNKLGFKTTSGEVKQNRGGGEGVTGTGTFPGAKRSDGRKQMHTSAITRMADPTKGQTPDSSRKPKDSTHAEQNDHLKHRSETDSDISKGKGNAAAQPSLLYAVSLERIRLYLNSVVDSTRLLSGSNRNTPPNRTSKTWTIPLRSRLRRIRSTLPALAPK